MSFFIKLEDKLINFLTSICWWFDLRFNLKSKDLANPFMALIGIFVGSIYLPLDEILILIILLCIFNILFPTTKNIYLKSEKLPNLNKADNSFKVGVLTGVILGIFFSGVTYPFFIGLLQLSWFYVLCTEPMPPAEKEKRLTKNKLSKFKLANQM